MLFHSLKKFYALIEALNFATFDAAHRYKTNPCSQHVDQGLDLNHFQLTDDIRSSLHDLFHDICDKALQCEGSNDDLGKYIVTSLLLAMERHPSLYDSRKKTDLRKLTSFLQRLDVQWLVELILHKLAVLWDFNQLSAPENPCPELARSLIGTSKYMDEAVQRVWTTSLNLQNSLRPETLSFHPYIRAVFCQSAGTMAAVLNNPDIKHMLSGLFGWQSLHLAAALGAPLVVKSLLRERMSVDARDSNGRTPIFLAAGAGCYECCEAFIEANADVNARDSFNHHILELPLRNGYSRVAKLLISAGSNVNPGFLPPCASTPLQAVFESPEIDGDMAQFLLDRNANPYAVRMDDKCAITWSEERQQYHFSRMTDPPYNLGQQYPSNSFPSDNFPS